MPRTTPTNGLEKTTFLGVSEGVGGLWFQILVTTTYLTQIDTRQKDLQLLDT